jgi:hypothetical protein
MRFLIASWTVNVEVNQTRTYSEAAVLCYEVRLGRIASGTRAIRWWFPSEVGPIFASCSARYDRRCEIVRAKMSDTASALLTNRRDGESGSE